MTETLRLLIVEDSEDDTILLVRALRGNGYDVSFKRVDTREGMEKAIRQKTWDIIISDYSMPTFSMFAALDVVNESGLDIPFIIVSGAIGEETAVKAMKAGAHDYIMKNNLTRLVPAIEREMREAERRRQRMQAQDDLRKSEEERARLYEQQVILAEIGRIITSSLDINDVYETFASSVRRLIPFDRITINLLNAEDDSITMAYVAGVDVPERRGGDLLSMSGTISEQVIRKRSPMIIALDDMLERRHELPGLEPGFRAGLQSVLAAPLISQDEIIGTLQFRSFDQDAYREQHIALAENIASQISGAVANAQLYAEQQRLKEQLLHAQKMEAVGRLAGGIAHDFNNLLTPIISYAQMGMMKLPTDDKVHHHLQEIYKAAERAADLISKLLAFSKRNFVEPRVIDLNGLVLNIENITRRLIGENIEISTSLDENLGAVKIDPGQMEQVLMNLIVNSGDAMPDGGKLMIATANRYLNEAFTKEHPDLTAGEYVMLAVTDNGIGMSEEVQCHMFEPFYTTKMPGKGTGLGLSTCYGIIKQSQGHIEAESKLGEGATITVYLPKVVQEASDSAHTDEESVMPTGNETILLVEDEPSVRDMTSLLLRDQGYTVVEASNGVEALQVLEELGGKGVDLLLTDVVMPQMGGWELSQEIRRLHPDTMVLYTSGFTDNEIFTRGVQERSVEFISKPYTPEILARKVRDVLDKSRSRSIVN